MESWGNFPHETERLVDLIATTGAGGLVLLSGDVHYAELSKLGEGAPYPLYDFTSSGLAQQPTGWGERFVNSYRVAGPFSGANFGLVEVDWDAQPSAQITLRAVDEQGRERFRRVVALQKLQPQGTE